MNIIIVGCGKVGRTLVEQLAEEGNNITAIDIDGEALRSIPTHSDVLSVEGNGATFATLREAGLERADLLIAVTNSDELNLLCCVVAKKAGNCQTIARVRDPNYSAEASFLKDEFELAMLINPEYAAALEISRVLRFPSAIKIDTFAKGRVELIKFRLPESSPLVSLSVREMSTVLKCDVLICTVERGDEAYIANGEFRFAKNDIISLIATPKNAAAFFEKINYKQRSVKDIIIVGGDAISQYLCEMLLEEGISVKLIEKDRDLCEKLCDKFPRAAVIIGDYFDKELLFEEGIAKAGAFAALTDQDEENILLSLFVKDASRAKRVTKVARTDFEEVIKHLDLDSVITPKNLTADMIIRYVRAKNNSIGSNVETLYNIVKGKVEVAEFAILEDSDVTGTPLSELRFKKDVLIASILRGKKVIIPRGYDMILPGDNVIVVSKQLGLNDITEILP